MESPLSFQRGNRPLLIVRPLRIAKTQWKKSSSERLSYNLHKRFDMSLPHGGNTLRGSSGRKLTLFQANSLARHSSGTWQTGAICGRSR
eukprot:911756-Rhodomonas_salina.2